jgi:uncharacterized iron-regulated protein
MKALAVVSLVVLAACSSAHVVSRLPAEVALADATRNSDVVFYGEAHDDRRQHDYEAELVGEIAAAAPKGAPILVGMEMFQRPFQEPLDDYVAGRIDEKEMLRRTEYFRRWSFDYTFYAPIWRWCRAHGARVVALNAEASIITKVRKGTGLSGLTADERSQLAADIDVSNTEHRARVEARFKQAGHPLSQPWYESMTAWDETMADSAADAFAAAGPGARMLVVAGSGHIENGTGIPDRMARRRPGLKRVVIVGETAESVETPPVVHADGQFVVAFPEREDEPPAPKLGIGFDEQPGREGVVVKSVLPGGSAANAGVAVGDVLSSLGGATLFDLTDVRYLVDAAKVGDVLTCCGLRDGAPISFTITLVPSPPPAPEAAPRP